MALPKYQDPELIATVIRLNGEGQSRAKIAKTTGVSAATIGRIAAMHGLNWDHSPGPSTTTAAVASAQSRARARRQALADRLYAAAERDLARLEANGYTHRINAGQSSFVVTDEVPNADEVRNHMQGIYSAIVSAAKLEALDTDPGVEVAKSTLRAIGQALGLPSRETT